MRVLDPKKHFNIMGLRKPAVYLSLVLVLASIASLAIRGLNFGVDFTGGYLIEVGYSQAVDLAPVREALQQSGFGDASVQHFGTSRDVLVRLAPSAVATEDSAAISNQILQALQSTGELEVRRVEFVGPQVGEELREQGGLAMIYALAGILIYVSLRYEKRLALGAVVALMHDVIITLGVFSFLQLNFDLTVLAAILAVIGYSLNDTIVVFDRLRENFRKLRKETPLETMNISVNETLSRTIMTGVTTLLVLLALFFLGGDVVHGFSLALIIGIFIGTYSSIYVAGAVALMLGVSRQDLLLIKKEGAEFDSRP